MEIATAINSLFLMQSSGPAAPASDHESGRIEVDNPVFIKRIFSDVWSVFEIFNTNRFVL